MGARILPFPDPKPVLAVEEAIKLNPIKVVCFTGIARTWAGSEQAVEDANLKFVRYQQQHAIDPGYIQVEPLQFQEVEIDGRKVLVVNLIIIIARDY